MEQVKVSGKDKAVLTGPVVLRLTRDQYAANAAALGPMAARGLYHVPAGAEVTLQPGEVFAIDVPAAAPPGVEPVQPAPHASPKGKGPKSA